MAVVPALLATPSVALGDLASSAWVAARPTRSDDVLDQLRKAEVLVVWKLDRVSRSLRDVVTIMDG